ncbi:MAG: putative lipoic acid-binding regulatory protein [Roseivirga sp.]|jgi:putative lipoic acid-binding regulatory protein
MSQFITEEFKKKLDDVHDFPTLYMFKFIVTEEKKGEVKSLFPSSELEYKPSSKGKYTSVTAKVMMQSSDHVIEVYKKAQNIKGIIAL